MQSIILLLEWVAVNVRVAGDTERVSLHSSIHFTCQYTHRQGSYLRRLSSHPPAHSSHQRFSSIDPSLPMGATKHPPLRFTSATPEQPSPCPLPTPRIHSGEPTPPRGVSKHPFSRFRSSTPKLLLPCFLPLPAPRLQSQGPYTTQGRESHMGPRRCGDQ